MNTKLLPPSIESKLPAQIGGILKIPYLHNRAVNALDCIGFAIIIKQVSTNLIVGEIINTTINDNNFKKQIEEFAIKDFTLQIGQFYKLQLAYVSGTPDNPIVGTYSSIGIFKYTAVPKIEVNTSDIFKIIGIYTTEDATEKVYSYRFDLYKDAELIETSGDKLHNSLDDTEIKTSQDIFEPKTFLENKNIYTIRYTITTINNLITSSELVEIIINNTITSTTGLMQVETNSDCACIIISAQNNLNGVKLYRILNHKKDLLVETDAIVSGNYFNDFSIEQGLEYEYLIIDQDGRQETLSTSIDFEDMYLQDAEHILRIKFNPKVSSFKEVVQESKLNTIGGAYPFFFRNGNTRYKEFSVSGLISYHMDDEQLFLKDSSRLNNNLKRSSTESIKAVSSMSPAEVIAAERRFKLAVLNWLNNGKPKLFRSPVEGNYIIRLMNVSFTPNDQLGRMLHTFNAVATEVAEYNYDNLKKYNLVCQEVE